MIKEYRIKQKPSILLPNEQQVKLLIQFGFIKNERSKKIDRYEIRKFPLFHLEFVDVYGAYSSNRLNLLATDRDKVYDVEVVWDKPVDSALKEGRLIMKDQGESFVIALTRRPLLFGHSSPTFEPLEIEYNPKAIW